MRPSSLRLVAASLLAAQACAHTWIEQLAVISANGSYVGNYGYPRNYIARTDPGFSGDKAQYLLPTAESGRTRINGSDLLCRESQRKQSQSQKWPRLNVAPGGYVAMKYAENGHVTLPNNQIGKPKKGGTVFVYGTLEPKDDEKIMNVLKWTTDGSGGDKRGKLLVSQNFDDNRCYQINSSPISTTRQKEYPDPIPGQPGTNNEQYCETDVKIPEDISSSKPYALYWVWQWPTAPNMDPSLPDGKDEWYTTCSDVSVNQNAAKVKTFQANSDKQQYKLEQQDPQTTAPGWYKDRSALTTDVWKGMVVSTSSSSAAAPAATTPSSAADSSSTPTKSTPSTSAGNNDGAGGSNNGPATVTVTMTGTPVPAATDLITVTRTVTAGAGAAAPAVNTSTPVFSPIDPTSPSRVLKSRIVGRRPQPEPQPANIGFIGAQTSASASSSSLDGPGMSYMNPAAPPPDSTGSCDQACVDAVRQKGKLTSYTGAAATTTLPSSVAALVVVVVAVAAVFA